MTDIEEEIIKIIPEISEDNLVRGVKFDSLFIPFKREMEVDEFINKYYTSLVLCGQILDFSKPFFKLMKTSWTFKELSKFLGESNTIQRSIIQILNKNYKINKYDLLTYLKGKHPDEVNSIRQIGPQISGIRIRTDNLGKEDLVLINKKDSAYEINKDCISILDKLLYYKGKVENIVKEDKNE